MSNNPYQSTTPDWAYTDKNVPKPRDWERREDNRRRCCMCDVPMTRRWFFIDVDGTERDTAENKFERDDFCSVRCMKRRLNGLPNDDEQAMNALLARVQEAEAEAKEANALANAHVAHLDTVRGALAALLQAFPGLVRGAVPPPGGQVARLVAALQSVVGQRVYADELPRRR